VRNFSDDKQFLGTYLNVEFTEYGTPDYAGQTVKKNVIYIKNQRDATWQYVY